MVTLTKTAENEYEAGPAGRFTASRRRGLWVARDTLNVHYEDTFATLKEFRRAVTVQLQEESAPLAPPANDYLRGLQDAIALCYAKPTAFAFSAAAEIMSLIRAENVRLTDAKKRNAHARAAIDYVRPV